MRKIIKVNSNKAITLISLVVAVAIMIIIVSLLVYNVRTGLKVRTLTMMENDISILDDKVNAYYVKYGALPISIKYNVSPLPFEDNLNPNDSSDGYYVLDLEAFEGLTLNYGSDFKKVTQENVANYTDLYIINEQSFQIYYAKGIEMDGVMYYTNDVSEEISLIKENMKKVEVNIEETNYVYDGTEKKPIVQIKYQDTILVENQDYTLTYENNKNAGTATIKINYEQPYYGDETLNFTIQKRTLTVVPSNISKTQGTPDPVLTSYYYGNVEGEVPEFEGELTRETGESAEVYDIMQGTLQLKDSSTFLASNYVLDVIIGRFTISPATSLPSLTINIVDSNYNKILGTSEIEIYYDSALTNKYTTLSTSSGTIQCQRITNIYYIKVVRTPDGYNLPAESIMVDLSKLGPNEEINIVLNEGLNLPETGS